MWLLENATSCDIFPHFKNFSCLSWSGLFGLAAGCVIRHEGDSGALDVHPAAGRVIT